MQKTTLSLLALGLAVALTPAHADQVIADDLIVDGSACIGLDCVNGESFGFDTLRLKENNLRIKAQDTSTSASFPSNDWQLTFNESSNGGANKFSVDDIDGGKVPFTIEAGARTNALYVEDDGDIGIGTNTPAVDLTVKTGNTPTLRLEQDGSSGFTAQTWDVAGNETNFFLRDATNGSKLPFRVRPNAPTSALDIAADGDIGVGTASPSAPIHVKRTTGASTTLLRLENDSAANMQMVNGADTWAINHSNSGAFIWDSQVGGVADGPEASLSTDGNLTLSDNGGVYLELKNASASDSWFNSHTNGGNYVIDSQVGGVADGPELTLDTAGNLTTAGTVNGASSRAVKHDIVPVDTKAILETVKNLEINTWVYNHDPSRSKHIGPMAEDFYEAFDVGLDNRHISSTDTAGVALASIQALSKENAELKARLKRIESLLSLK